MNKITTLLAALTISFTAIAGGTTVIPTGDEVEETTATNTTAVMRDVQTGLTANVVEDQAFFNLKMLNESEDAVYSLVRYNNDGSFTSIGILDAVPNTINQPILYSFVDEEIVDEDATYALLKIGFEVEEITTWSYKAETGALVSMDTMWSLDNEEAAQE